MAERFLARRHLRRRVLQRHQILYRQGRRALRMVTKTVEARQSAQWMSIQPAKIGIGCDDPRALSHRFSGNNQARLMNKSSVRQSLAVTCSARCDHEIRNRSTADL